MAYTDSDTEEELGVHNPMRKVLDPTLGPNAPAVRAPSDSGAIPDAPPIDTRSSFGSSIASPEAPPIKPQSTFSERFHDWSTSEPQRNDPQFNVPTWKKVLGGLSAGVAGTFNPRVNAGELYSDVANAPYNRAEEQWKNKGAEIQKEAGLADTEAQMRQREAEAEEKRNPQPKPKEEIWKVNPNFVGPNGEPVLEEQNSGTLRLGGQNIPGIKRVEKPETQEQNKLAFQGVVNKLDAAGLSTDPKNIDKSLDGALKRGVITQQEHATARAYQAANPTPGTNLTVHVAGAQATQGMKDARQHYLYSDEDGTTHLVTGDKVPPGADALPVKDPQMFIGEAENANIVQKSFAKLAKDDDLSIFSDAKARTVLATALSEEGARTMGLLVAGTGGSIAMPAGSGKIIDQILENNAVPQNLRRAVKDYIADYWAMKDKMLMVQMAMQQGKMGRGNKAYFDAMVSQLPGPGTADEQMARRQLADFNETLTELKKRYPDKFGDYRKEPDLKPEQFGSSGGGGQQFNVKAGGKTYVFKDQQSLDNFKREAGIK
jgi:hypothetical protein